MHFQPQLFLIWNTNLYMYIYKIYNCIYNTHVCVNASGYLAPEYAMRGILTEKTDVYAFGIVALELVSGRKNSDVNLGNEKKYLLEWVSPCLLVKIFNGKVFIKI